MDPDPTVVSGVLVAIAGLFLLGWGYRLMRIAMAMAGLLLGAALGWEVCRALDVGGLWVWIGMAGGAALLAALMPLVRRAGMFLLGFSAAWGLAALFIGPPAGTQSVLVHAAAGLAGGMAILFLERIVLIVATSYLGGLSLVLGFGTVTGIGLSASQFLEPGGATLGWPVIAAVLGLTALGIAVQFARGGKKRQG